MANVIFGILAAIAGILGAVLFGKSRKVKSLEKQNRELANERAKMESGKRKEAQRADAAEAKADLNAAIAKVAIKVGDDAEEIYGEGRELTDEEKIRACRLAEEAGADFVKTSTGFSKGGATVHDVALMRSVVGDRLGVKASGGVRDYATAKAMIEAGATRIGASAGIAIAREENAGN